MLACPQDIFLNDESNNDNQNNNDKNSDQFNKEKRPKQMKHANSHSFMSSQPSAHVLSIQQQQDNTSNKDKEEQQVWPPDVEAAFIKALETIPKLGRRKILVNGKPCGRNELISDFIYRKTSKVRTRKQVSSHIQVLKNTRKGDPYFMRLLTDTVEDEGFATTTQSTTQTKKSKQSATTSRRQNSNNQHKAIQARTSEPLSSDESSMSSSPSSADYALDNMYHDQQNSISMLDIKDPFYEPFFGSLGVAPTPVTDDSNNASYDPNEYGIAPEMLQQFFPDDTNAILDQQQMNNLLVKTPKKSKKSHISKKQQSKKQKKSISQNSLTNEFSSLTFDSLIPLPTGNNGWIDSSIYPLWPNYICLYLEYSLPYDPSITIPHTLAALPECIPSCIPAFDGYLFDSTKCPAFPEITSNPAVTSLLAKVKLNLNLNMTDFMFNNTSFFETQERRTIECTTTIYSFGNVVLESKEVQQALWINEGKYVYSFVYVNQFFDAFMKGIRSLQCWEEVDIAINNLCVVQVFEDIESKFIQQQQQQQSAELGLCLADPNTDGIKEEPNFTEALLPVSPLLVMVYEFERGHGTMDVSIVNTNSNSYLQTTDSSNDSLINNDIKVDI